MPSAPQRTSKTSPYKRMASSRPSPDFLPQKAKKLTRLRVSRASWVDSAPPRRPLAGLSTCTALPWRGLACETGGGETSISQKLSDQKNNYLATQHNNGLEELIYLISEVVLVPLVVRLDCSELRPHV